MQNGTIDSFVSVYSDARSEYIKQLCIFLVPAYFKWYIGLFEKAKESTASEPKKHLWQFQNYLGEIPDWNMEKVNYEIGQIQTASGCDYLEDLLTAVFIAHTKVLTAIRLSSKQKKVQITVPKVEHFLFKVLCETGKLIWGSSYLFSDSLPSIERQKNFRSIENLIAEGIHQSVRAMVPVKSILKDFINHDGDDDEDDHDSKNEKAEEEEVIAPPVSAIIPEEAPTEQSAVIESLGTVLEESSNINKEALNDSEKEIPEKPTEDKKEPVETITSKEVIQMAPLNEVPIINLDESLSKEVTFTEYDTVFKPSDPEGAELVYEPKDEDDESDNFDLSAENTVQIVPDNDDNLNGEEIPIADIELLG